MTVDAVKNIEDLAAFVAESPVSYLAARTVARRLQAAGFTELVETEAWDPQIATGRHFVVREARLSPGLAARRRRRQAVTACWVRTLTRPL